jgi:hypothetical protein
MASDSRIITQEQKVASLRQREEAVRRERELEEAVLRGMRLMVSDGRPFNPDASLPDFLEIGVDTLVAPRRGRQPGAISREWRNALRILHRGFPGGFDISEAVETARHVGLPKVKDRDAEDRMRAYLDLGYVERVDGGYRVSELAAQRYGFTRQTTEAPPADAEGAS